MNQTAMIIGATGLTGRHLLNILQENDAFRKIKVLVRRPVAFDHPKVEVITIDFADEASFKKAIEGSDVMFCCVGTTNKKVKGNKEAYRKVDHDIPVNAARFCAETNSAHFLLISAVGANSKSGNFYLRLKGEVEDEISKMDIPAVSIFRPSMLLGKREESRPGEKAGKIVMSAFSFLIPSKYKPIAASDVAKAMVAAFRQNTLEVHIYHYKEMKELSDSYI